MGSRSGKRRCSEQCRYSRDAYAGRGGPKTTMCAWGPVRLPEVSTMTRLQFDWHLSLSAHTRVLYTTTFVCETPLIIGRGPVTHGFSAPLADST